MTENTFYYMLGRPFSPVYSMAMRLREWGYRRGALASYRFSVPVISVGNLTLGGTGKTPMVQYLARLLQQQGYKPAVISRGYGGKAGDRVNVVSNGQEMLLDAAAAGDEPRLLAETLPGVPVLTGIVRRLPAKRAIELGADVLLLDDGFQHLQIDRDVNLVLFSTDRLAGNSRVFPGGDLREPVAGLHRATGFVMTGVHEGNRERAIQFTALLSKRFPQIPSTLVSQRTVGPVRFGQNGGIETCDAGEVIGRRCFGFAGIAHPESFRRTIEEFGLNLRGFCPFRDHQRYSQPIFSRLMKAAQEVGADVLLTTEKDLVKLSDITADLPIQLFGLRVTVVADGRFNEAFVQTVQSCKGRAR